MAIIDFELDDRLGARRGTVAMSGIQALLRVPLDQQRADAAAGVRTAGLIAGYRGSPITGIDEAYERDRDVLEAHEIRFISGVNEDLAATMIWGSQAAHLEPDCRFDGVTGLWYGKGPGIDRSLDALRHANLSGVGRHGGVIAAVGDDPACKSSTVPSASEGLLANLGMPALYPGSAQELLDFGRWAYELSRTCGLWTGMKIHTDVADQYATVDVDPARLGAVTRPDLDGWVPAQSTTLVPATSLGLETDAFGPRIDAALAFVGANRLDLTFGAGTEARLGIVAPGKVYADVRSVLSELGLITDDDLDCAGIRIYKPALIWPIEPAGIRRFARGLDEIIVVEEKRAFVETQVRDLLFDLSVRPTVLGKRDDEGRPLLPGAGALTADLMTDPLARRISAVLPEVELRRPRTRISIADLSHAASDGTDPPTRTPYFCSGCPHNRSTIVPEGSVAAAGIGCHTMATWMDRDTVGLTHMGGEGAQWAGMAPFVSQQHRFQNIGDGTLFHSGTMAIRQAVAAGTNITYKVLYNGTVAMTGGQDAAGNLPVPDLTRLLEAEGVVETVVVTDDVAKYDPDATPDVASGRSHFGRSRRRAHTVTIDDPCDFFGPAWATNTRIEHRDNYDDVQRRLRDVPGVTAIIYDQRCAAELRRDRKRGRVATPTKRIVINEAVCDGCGDCGRVSNCVSVHPVSTPFGRKTRIHQESCNYDYTCVKGNCPAFIEVHVDPDAEGDQPVATDTSALTAGPELTDPRQTAAANVLIVGIGGTGVVTVNQLLATAALLDGKRSLSLDQTGLAQKGGQVISNLRIEPSRLGSDVSSAEGTNTTARIGGGEADVALVFDAVGACADDILSRCAPDRTTAIVSTGLLPTGQMVRAVGAALPQLDDLRSRIDVATRADTNTWIDAEGIARGVFASQPAANLIVVGLAHQQGLLPLTAAAIEAAITQNGVAVDTNISAFRLGRRLAHDPNLAAKLSDPHMPSEPAPLTGTAAQLAARVSGDRLLDDVLAWRIPELIAYADASYAGRYVEVVARSREAELALGVDDTRLSRTVAEQLFRLMAYKDEYEVARLHLQPELGDEIRDRFGAGARFSFLLAPPTLKKLGRTEKVAFSERAGRAMFATLAKGRRARGTRFDPFAHTDERRIERALIHEYPALVDQVLGHLTRHNLDEAIELLALADQIRGFDEVKLANVARYRADVADALAAYLS